MSTCLTCHKKATIKCKNCSANFCELDWKLTHDESNCNLLIAGKGDWNPVVLVVSPPGEDPQAAKIAAFVLKTNIAQYEYIVKGGPTPEEAASLKPFVIFVVERMTSARKSLTEAKISYMRSLFTSCPNVMFLYLLQATEKSNPPSFLSAEEGVDGGFWVNRKGETLKAPRLLINFSSLLKPLPLDNGQPLPQNTENFAQLKKLMEVYFDVGNPDKGPQPGERKYDGKISIVHFPEDSSLVELQRIAKLLSESFTEYKIETVRAAPLSEQTPRIVIQDPDIILVPYLIDWGRDPFEKKRVNHLRSLYAFAPHVMFLYRQNIIADDDLSAEPTILEAKDGDGGFDVMTGEPKLLAPRLYWILGTPAQKTNIAATTRNNANLAAIKKWADIRVAGMPKGVVRPYAKPSQPANPPSKPPAIQPTNPVPKPAATQPKPQSSEVAVLKAEIAQMKKEFKEKKAKYQRIVARTENEKKVLEEKLRQITQTNAGSQDVERLKQINTRLQSKIDAIQKVLSQ